MGQRGIELTADYMSLDKRAWPITVPARSRVLAAPKRGSWVPILLDAWMCVRVSARCAVEALRRANLIQRALQNVERGSNSWQKILQD